MNSLLTYNAFAIHNRMSADLWVRLQIPSPIKSVLVQLILEVKVSQYEHLLLIKFETKHLFRDFHSLTLKGFSKVAGKN